MTNYEAYADCISYSCISGSVLYGLNHDGSDVDIRGYYIPPMKDFVGLGIVPEQLEDPRSDSVFWEVGKFLRLALAGNPNVLECLFSDRVLHADEYARELMCISDSFLSKRIINTYGGYARGQYHRLERDERTNGEWNFKHAMHMLRLLYSGRLALETGTLKPNVGDKRELFLAVRRKEHSKEQVLEWYKEYTEAFDAAADNTSLPDEPDYDKVNKWLVEVRMDSINIAPKGVLKKKG